jgi:hypothetical protein
MGLGRECEGSLGNLAELDFVGGVIDDVVGVSLSPLSSEHLVHK